MTTQSTSPLTLNTLALMLQGLGIHLSVVPSTSANETIPVPGPVPPEQRQMPGNIDSRTLKALVEALAQVDYDVRDEAAPFISTLEAQEAEAEADRLLALQLIEEDQAELAAQADDVTAALARATLDPTNDNDNNATPGPSAPDDDDDDDNDAPAQSVWAGDINPACPPSFSGFKCANCYYFNLLRTVKDPWYVVTRGKKVGIFNDWLVVSPLVDKVSGAIHKKYPSYDAAQRAWELAKAQKLVRTL